MLRATLVLFTCLTLTACASRHPADKLHAGIAEQDVIAILGQPAQVIQNSDGTRTLDYSTQPNGITTRFVLLDARGKVDKIENPLIPTRREKVIAGMKQQEVLQLLGQPAVTEHIRNTTSAIWTWYVGNNNRQAGERFQVRFRDGVVFNAITSWRVADDACTDQSCLNN